ncbi:MAG: GH3 auxin-responsive promoter family protein [Spirochaetales bacterium]|nr:GH3 auxin-responsive promoter family protein [Spirochaetales bacterium]
MEVNLWEKYCSFLDKDFSWQVKWNEEYMRDYLEDFKKTKMAKQLCPGGVKTIESIPLTTYSDYPILHEFGEKLEALKEKNPRKKGEDFCAYYDKLSRQIISMLDGWMTNEYAFSVMTSGTSGKSKWFVHSDVFWKNMVRSSMALLVVGCSDKMGETNLNAGDVIFVFGASAPYMGGYMIRAFQTTELKIIPPVEVISEIPGFMKKAQIALKYAKNTKKIDLVVSTPSVLKLTSLYFTNKEELFHSSYTTTSAGIKKIILWLLWKYEHTFGKKLNKLKEVINPKGIAIGSFDTELYLDYIRDQFELEPVTGYASTETGFPLYGRPWKKSGLFPDLSTGYFEFLDRNEKIRKINELQKGEIYELVFTPYRSILIRYKTGDLLKVLDFQADGLPSFCVDGRNIQILDFYNYFRFSLSLAFKIFNRAGFPPSNNWVFKKELEPREHLLLLMEKELDLSEKQVSKKLFDALKAENQEFCNYVTDFKITEPEEVIKVEYLKPGAFNRYTEKKIKEGVPIGMIKPLRILTADKNDAVEFLKGA